MTDSVCDKWTDSVRSHVHWHYVRYDVTNNKCALAAVGRFILQAAGVTDRYALMLQYCLETIHFAVQWPAVSRVARFGREHRRAVQTVS